MLSQISSYGLEASIRFLISDRESCKSGIFFSYADNNDLVILISSSGQSDNIVNAAKRAKEMGLQLITFSGFSSENPLRSIGDINFWIDSNNYNYVEMTHHIWLLSICDFIIAKTNT